VTPRLRSRLSYVIADADKMFALLFEEILCAFLV